MTSRFKHIDFLRAIAIIVVIATHTFSYHLSNPIYFSIWNYLHFAVPIFVFCSGYVLIAKYREGFATIKVTLAWYWKRFKRLLIPFFIYLLVHYSLWFALPKYFSGLALQKNFSFMLQSLLLVGGADSNWLPLLFLELTLLFPLIVYSLKKKRLVVLTLLLSLASILFFTIKPFPYAYYRSVMVLSWISIIFLSIFEYYKGVQVGRYLAAGFAGLVVFFYLTQVLKLGEGMILTKHKYPPDAYYLLFSVSVMYLILAVSQINSLYRGFLGKFFLYISRHSYSLFFIHYLVLDFTLQATKGLSFWSNPFIQFTFVLFISLGVNFLPKYFSNFSKRILLYPKVETKKLDEL